MKNKLDFSDPIFIDSNNSLFTAFERMNSLNKKLLIVLEESKFIGVLSIGDIQRAIIAKKKFESKITEILRKNFVVCYNNENIEDIKQKMIQFRIECMPILDANQNLIDLIFWNDIFEFNYKKNKKKKNLNIPIIIMAGGKGSRLKPLTNIFPKPLLPINEKTIIENIMDRFVDIGCNNFFISVNYKSEIIKSYFKNLNNQNYIINYFEEDKPLGTAGSIFLIKNKINETCFVTNCDILIDQDLEEIYNYHIENKNLITIVSALKSYKIPYGTLQTKKDGILYKLDEKPEIIFQINTGMYILEPELLKLIPDNEFLHITDLISEIIKKNGRVGVFPISESAWQDIGNWKDYNNLLIQKRYVNY
jgi:dTDP-glucose pyrophosphorylase